MFTMTKLAIQGFEQAPVPNTFFRQNKATEHATIVLPGMGYTCQGPVLSYPAAELLARGADVLYVEYNTGRSTIHREEVEDAIAACQVLLQQRPYKQLTVIGKSLGTMVMSYLLTSLPPDLLSVQAIWMTPVLTLPIFQEQWRKITYPSLFVIGSADPYYDTDRLQQAREAGCEVLVIEGANHGLLIENDVIVSIRAMEQVILSIRTLLDQ